MSKYKILYTDTDNESIDIEASVLKKIDAEIHMASGMDKATIIEEGKDCDAILTTYANIDKEVLDAWGKEGKVKVISRQGIGVNNIDLKAATDNKIMVANVSDYCFDEVADHTMALALASYRQIKEYNMRVIKGDWREMPDRSLRRARLLNFGLYGLGNISLRVAKRAQAFGFTVMAFDPYIDDSVFKDNGIIKMDNLTELAAESDILSVHAPLTKETKHSIDADVFNKMKKGTILINTARGPLVDEKAMVEALDKGILAAAGLDVLEDEPPVKGFDLAERKNVIITSHVAFYSEEANVELLTKLAENIVDTFEKGKPKYLVNREVLS